MKKQITITILLLLGILAGCSSKEDINSKHLEPTGENQSFPVYEESEKVDSEITERNYLSSVQECVFWDIFNNECAVKDAQIYAFAHHMEAEKIIYEINVYDVEGRILRTIPLSYYQEAANVASLYYCKGIQIAEDDTIWLLIQNVTEDGSSHLQQVSQEGSTLQDILLGEITADGTIGYIDLAQDSEGRMYTLNCEKENILILNPDGSIYGEVSLENLPRQVAAVNPWYLVSSKEGEVYVALAAAENENASILYQVLPETLECSDTAKTLPMSHVRLLGAGLGGDFLCTKNESLWEVSFNETESVELLNWLEAGVDWNRGIVALQAVDEDTIVAVVNKADGNDGSMFWVTIKQGNADKISQSITVASLTASYDLQGQIAYFNRENDIYVVKLKEYCEDIYDKVACEEALKLLNEDIKNAMAGDILDLESLQGLACQREYQEELENLYSWILTDEQTKDLDFLPNLLKANEIDGALYSLIPSVQMETMLARTALVGKKYSLSLGEANQILNSNVGMELSPNLSREDFLYEMYRYNEDTWVNFSEKSCQFDSDSFEEYLEYANTLPTQMNSENLTDNNWNKIYRGEALLAPVVVSTTLLENYQVMEATIGKETSAVGFVTEQGNGSLFVPRIFLGMLADSQQKAGAWEFLKSFLSEEYQNNLINELPVLESAVEKWLDRAAEENSGEERRAGTADYEVIYGSISEAQLEEIQKLIYAVDKIDNMDSNIYQIILEESADYFAEICTVKETCKAIQSRAERYLAE